MSIISLWPPRRNLSTCLLQREDADTYDRVNVAGFVFISFAAHSVEKRFKCAALFDFEHPAKTGVIIWIRNRDFQFYSRSHFCTGESTARTGMNLLNGFATKIAVFGSYCVCRI
jgi:hypothetical protein